MIPIEFYYGLAIGILSGVVSTFIILLIVAGTYASRKDTGGGSK